MTQVRMLVCFPPTSQASCAACAPSPSRPRPSDWCAHRRGEVSVGGAPDLRRAPFIVERRGNPARVFVPSQRVQLLPATECDQSRERPCIPLSRCERARAEGTQHSDRVRRQAKVCYGCFSCFGGDGNVALVFPLPVSKATGDGYPLPFRAAISITTSF